MAWIAVALAAWVGVGWAAPRLPARQTLKAVPFAGEAAPVAVPTKGYRTTFTAPSTSRAEATPSARSTPTAATSWQQLTDADLRAISFADLPPDSGIITPLAADYRGLDAAGKSRLDAIQDKLAYWPPGAVDDPVQRVRNLLSVCAVADLAEDDNEGEIARAVFNQIHDAVPANILPRVLGWISLHPTEGQVVLDVSDFGIAAGVAPDRVRERCEMYARKYLRDLTGASAAHQGG
jgi:hypothetical protein